MNDTNLKPLIAAMTALTAAFSGFSYSMGAFSDLSECDETYIRVPKIPVKKYNRIMDLAYNHRKKRVRKKNLNRLAESQILIYAEWDWINGGDL